MIEFSLRIEPKIISSILPELGKYFSKSRELEDFEKTVPNFDEEDLKEMWIEGLKDDRKKDRNALAKLLESPRLAYGRVEVADDDINELLRGLTELRFTIRKTSLKQITDEELESGLHELSSTKPEIRIGYFAYLILAEIQERLIQEIS